MLRRVPNRMAVLVISAETNSTRAVSLVGIESRRTFDLRVRPI